MNLIISAFPFCHRTPQLAIKKVSVDGKIKENVGFYLLLVPRIEAFALPTVVERATSKPTLICVHYPLYDIEPPALRNEPYQKRDVANTHPEGIYL
jgi:hypothetical protein